MAQLTHEIQIRYRCGTCDGTGQVPTNNEIPTRCPDCAGEGKRYQWVPLKDIYALFDRETATNVRRLANRPGGIPGRR